MDKRHTRMLEELLLVPGNETCADCKAPAPRWASVNLGIFLCVHCASVHRKMGTHRSRVKSVTLDSWSRENIATMKQIGNKAANAVWNPNEALHPPPTSFGAEERDSEVEKYIRRKYEQGAFRADARSNAGLSRAAAPTSLNRAREADGRLAPGSVTGFGAAGKGESRRKPELDDVVWKKVDKQVDRDRDLPALPVGTTGAPPRPRPAGSSGSTPAPQPFGNPSSASVSNGANAAQRPETLVDLNGSTSSTLPLQMNVPNPSSPYASSNVYNPFAQGAQSQHQQYLQTSSPFQPQYANTTPLPQNAFANGLQVPSPNPGYGLSTSVPSNGMYHSLSSFDPHHPASHQQQQQQQQQSQSYSHHQVTQGYAPGVMFQQQSFSQPFGQPNQAGGMGMSHPYGSAPQHFAPSGQASMQHMQQHMANGATGQFATNNTGGMAMGGYTGQTAQWNPIAQQMGMANGYMAGGMR